jgi:hypothetical protein
MNSNNANSMDLGLTAGSIVRAGALLFLWLAAFEKAFERWRMPPPAWHPDL